MTTQLTTHPIYIGSLIKKCLKKYASKRSRLLPSRYSLNCRCIFSIVSSFLVTSVKVIGSKRFYVQYFLIKQKNKFFSETFILTSPHLPIKYRYCELMSWLQSFICFHSLIGKNLINVVVDYDVMMTTSTK